MARQDLGGRENAGKNAVGSLQPDIELVGCVQNEVTSHESRGRT